MHRVNGHDDHILLNKLVSMLFHEVKIFSPLCNDGINDSKKMRIEYGLVIPVVIPTL